MLEVVFSDSAAGSMAVAMGKGKDIGGVASVIVAGDGPKPSPEEIQEMERQAQERERKNWERAIPLEGSRKDIICFSCALSVGEINEEGIGPKREAALRMLMDHYPQGEQAAQEMLESSRKSLEILRQRAAGGEPVRIWSGNNPDEICGLYWLMEQLRPIGFENLELTLVRLPDFEEQPDGTVQQYSGWGEMEPHRWGEMTALGKKLPVNLARGMGNRWRILRQENAPLRALLNGRLVSMPETLYDSFILRELEKQPKEFMAARLVGTVLGKYPLGIGDTWVWLRLKQMIQAGNLEYVTKAAADDPAYHCWLRKEKERL